MYIRAGQALAATLCRPPVELGEPSGSLYGGGIRIASHVIRLRLGHAIFLIGRRRQNLRRA